MAKVILVAEDDSFLGETICVALKEHGVEAHLAADGEEAIAYLDAKKPDLLLLDLIMPKKDGFAVLEHIKNKNYALPVIILSNLSTDLSPEKCRSLHAKDYILKSDIDEDELWPKVSKYL
jgi:DNA-binding response OmpR family regulator